jgi:peptidyl-tRNA hydrolase, PTH1 family
MKVIVGLGNPGKEYEGTRHNVGFELVDALAAAHSIKVDSRMHKSLVGRGTIGDNKVMLVKPQTFMNLSGEAVTAVLQREVIHLPDLLIVCDDIHLPVGRIRLRGKGSSGGQNGLKSIASHLATQEFARLRIGVGEPPPGLQVEWVLGRFSRADRKEMDDTLITAMGAVEVWLKEDIEAAMCRFNGGPG